MKRATVSTVIVLALACAAFAAAAPTVKPHTATVVSRNGLAKCVVKFPQISGTAVDAAVNRQLRAFFVPPQKQLEAEAKEVLKGQRYSSDIGYEVTLATPSLLSVKYRGLAMPTQNGQIASAHPEKIYHDYTFDLRSGKLIPLASLFKKGVDWKKALDAIVVAKKVPVDPPATYSFYLTGKKLVLTQLSDSFAAADVEVPILLTELKDVLDPNGPTASLIK